MKIQIYVCINTPTLHFGPLHLLHQLCNPIRFPEFMWKLITARDSATSLFKNSGTTTQMVHRNSPEELVFFFSFIFKGTFFLSRPSVLTHFAVNFSVFVFCFLSPPRSLPVASLHRSNLASALLSVRQELSAAPSLRETPFPYGHGKINIPAPNKIITDTN